MTESGRGRGSHLGLSQDWTLLLQLQQLSLLLEDLSRLLQHHLEALFSLGGVLLEPLNRKLFNTVLDLLPASAEGGYLCSLCEGCTGCGSRGRGSGLVYARLANVDEVGHGHVHGAEGELLGDGVDVGRLVDHGQILGAQDRGDPFRGALAACDEAF